MEALIACVIGLSFGAAAYIVGHQRMGQKVVIDRLSNVSAMSFPYPVPLSADRKNEVTVDVKLSKFEKALFLAGLRNKKHMKFFEIIRQVSLAVPLVVVIAGMLFGSLTRTYAIRAAVAGIFLYSVSLVVVHVIKRRRQAQILRSMPQFIDLMVVCVEAGMGFTAALERVLRELDKKDALTAELSQMYHEFLGGLSLGEACDRLNKRCQVPDLAILLAGIVQSEHMGSSLGNNLRVQADDIRDKYRQRLRAKAHKIPVKIIFPMLLSFGMIFFLTAGPAFYQMSHVFSNDNKTQEATVTRP